MTKTNKRYLTMPAENHFFMKSILTIWYFVSLSVATAWAQSGKLFDTDTQLSSNFVTQVYQDANGFVWIATRNGLNVYDGYNFTVKKKNGEDPQALNTNYINCIAQDFDNHILLGTNRGLLLHNGQSFTNIPLSNDSGTPSPTYVTSIYKRRNGDALVTTSGLGIYEMKKGEHTCQRIKGTEEKMKYTSRIMEDRQGNLWIITEGGQLYKRDKQGKFTTHFAGTEGLVPQEMKEDSKGTLYLATKNQGIYRMTAGSTVFTRISSIGNLPVQTIYLSRSGKLLIGCDGEGIKRYDPLTGIVTDNLFFSAQVNLSKSKVQNIIEDAQGNIWFSMLQKGVFMQPQGLYDFSYMGHKLGNGNIIGDNCVTSVLLDEKSNLWVGTDKDGIYKLSPNGSSLQAHYLPTTTILATCQDQDGRIWVGTYTDGFGYLDATGTYHRIHIEGMDNVGVFDIKCDRQGTLWLATMGAGLVRINKTGAPILYKVKKRTEGGIHVNNIPNDYIAKLALSKDHSRVYLATSIGIACLDTRKNSWTSVLGGKNCINKNSFSHAIFVDSKDRIWYGSEDGVYLYGQGGKLQRHYTTADGLSGNSIASIIEDYKGRIWISTTSGLSKLNPDNGTITRFYAENGLQSNEFSDGAACASADKRIIIMGGTGGVNWFDTDKVKQHPWKAAVNITGLLIGNRSVAPGMKSGIYTIAEGGVYESSQFDLSHEDNSFTLQFSTLTYNNVEQITYVYSINGEEWQKVQTGQNELSFTHLPAGTYKFRLKAMCNGYETPVREFAITVHPVWYASFWAKFAYLLAFLGLCLLYFQHRKRKEEDRLLLQKHIHAEEMGEAKLKFFMNISHEIRTPLTLILTPLLSLIKEDKDTHRQGIYDMMRKNSERILHLINQMMDLRKIDKGQMVMHMSETDMVGFIGDEYKLFEQQAKAKHIHFSFEHADEQLPVWIDRDNFDKVLMNVLSNAFKFTPTGGKVAITLTHSPHHVRIYIKDSGKGIDADKLETIFQRFYQSPTGSKDHNTGTGIGLDLTRSLVELHYGTIVASNNKDKNDPEWKTGSEFLITLPLGKEHLKPEEMLESLPESHAHEDIMELNEVQEADGESQPQEEEPATARGTRNTIAIVEDDEAILEYLEAQLGNIFHVSTYHNGKEALPEIIRQRPDLVISDVMMPEMDGNTLCAKLKSNVNTNHIPVILLSAMSREEDQLTGLQTGADAYIAKPFNMDILRRTVINLLNMRRTLRNKFTGSESQTGKVEDVKLESVDDKLMKEVMRVINENISNEDLSVEMIAQMVGISRVHLHRKMKELTNQTPHVFIRNVRLQQAAKLLRESKKSIAEVMYSCGFANAASFSTIFKNTFGASPRDYMNEHQAK